MQATAAPKYVKIRAMSLCLAAMPLVTTITVWTRSLLVYDYIRLHERSAVIGKFTDLAPVSAPAALEVQYWSFVDREATRIWTTPHRVSV